MGPVLKAIIGLVASLILGLLVEYMVELARGSSSRKVKFQRITTFSLICVALTFGAILPQIPEPAEPTPTPLPTLVPVTLEDLNKAIAEMKATQSIDANPTIVALQQTATALARTQLALAIMPTAEPTQIPTPTFDPTVQTDDICSTATVISFDQERGRIYSLSLNSEPRRMDTRIDIVMVGGEVEVYCGSPPLTDDPWSIMGYVKVRFNNQTGYMSRRYLRSNQ